MNPFTTKPQYSPDTLEAAIRHLRDSEQLHIQLGQAAMHADHGKLFSEDLVVLGVIQRSLDLIDGFTTLTEKGNSTAAIPLLRLQLDNCMRFFACALVHDASQVVGNLLSGKPINKIKSRSGNRLTDQYLHEQLNARYPWFSQVYKFASGFIHLSTPGMVGSVAAVGSEKQRIVYHHIGFGAGRAWKEAEKKEAVDAFIGATEVLCDLLGSWGVTKEKVAGEHYAADQHPENARVKMPEKDDA